MLIPQGTYSNRQVSIYAQLSTAWLGMKMEHIQFPNTPLLLFGPVAQQHKQQSTHCQFQ